MIHVDPAEWLIARAQEARSIGAVLASLPEVAALHASYRVKRVNAVAALRPFSG